MFLQDGAINSGMLFANPPPLPLGDFEEKDHQKSMGGSPAMVLWGVGTGHSLGRHGDRLPPKDRLEIYVHGIASSEDLPGPQKWQKYGFQCEKAVNNGVGKKRQYEQNERQILRI
jgi:hypothetical protein